MDESILDSILQDSKLQELYGEKPDREAIRQLLAEMSGEPEAELFQFSEEDDTDNIETAGQRIGNIVIEMDSSGLEARLSLLEPEDGEEPATVQDIQSALQLCGVVSGVNESYVKRLAAMPIYYRSFLIAKGREAVDGMPGTIKYYFDEKKNFAPREMPDGRLNFMELDFAQNVNKGDLLCELISGSQGVDGYTVTGMILKAAGDGDTRINGGQNTAISEDKKQLFAACDGEVSLRDGKVIVDKVLRVPNVDAATGNLRFIGSLYVEGRICEGFTVRVTGNITVGEVIEGADVSADGDVQVAQGIKGAMKGKIKVGGSLRSSFIENMDVFVNGDIYADVIMSSTVDCEGKISLLGRKGRLIGGNSKAMQISAFEIGNDSHIRTEIEIKQTDGMEWECSQIECELKTLQTVERKLQALALDDRNPGRVKAQKDLLSAIYKKNVMLSRKAKLEEFISHVKSKYSFDVTSRSAMYPEVCVKIGALTHVNRELQQSCVYFRKDNHIVVRRYYH